MIVRKLYGLERQRKKVGEQDVGVQQVTPQEQPHGGNRRNFHGKRNYKIQKN